MADQVPVLYSSLQRGGSWVIDTVGFDVGFDFGTGSGLMNASAALNVLVGILDLARPGCDCRRYHRLLRNPCFKMAPLRKRWIRWLRLGFPIFLPPLTMPEIHG
jgi:hypothetical protein